MPSNDHDCYKARFDYYVQSYSRSTDEDEMVVSSSEQGVLPGLAEDGKGFGPDAV